MRCKFRVKQNSIRVIRLNILYNLSVGTSFSLLPLAFLVILVFAVPSRANQVFSWGRNYFGQLNVPANLSNAVAISAGYQHCFALKSDGTLLGWGQNTNGQLNLPAPVSNNVVAVSAGAYHSLALLNDGSVVAWGAGLTNAGVGHDFGQSIIPPNVTNVLAIAAGGYFSMALLTDRTVAVWGINNYGQTNIPPGLTNVAAIAAAGFHCMVLKGDGSVVAWGGNGAGELNVPTALSSVVAIAAANYNSHAIKPDGALVVWGDNTVGQSTVPAGLSNVVTSAGGTYHGVAIDDTGKPVSWGSYDSTLPVGLTNAIAVAGGFYMGLALTNDGSPIVTAQPASRWIFSGNDTAFRALVAGVPPMSYQWSFNGTPIPNATNAALPLPAVQTNNAGAYSFVVSNSLGVIFSSNATLTVIEQPPFFLTQPASLVTYRYGPATFSCSVAGALPMTFQWRLNGTKLPGATNAVLTYANVPPWSGGSYSVVVSNQFGVAVSTNAFLTLLQVLDAGNINYNYSHYAVPVSLTNVVAIAAGSFHSLALKPDNSLVAWGNNNYGQANFPAAATNIMSIAAGGNTCAVLRSNGTVIMWGDGYEFNGNYGKTNPPASATNVVSVVVGDYHCLALRKNGTVVAWGRGNEKQTLVPANATNIMAVAVGAYHSLALRSNGTLIAWGSNSYGQTNVPASLTNVIAISAAGGHNFVLKSDGTTYSWGDVTGSFPYTNIVAVGCGGSSGENYFTILRGDGRIVGGYVSSAIVSNAIAIASGSAHNLVLLGDGAPYLYWLPNALPPSHPGDTVSTRVDVSGTGPIFYQWQLNGANIIGATNATLTLTNIPITSAGTYRCIVSNALGIITSPGTTLAVERYPLRFSTNVGATQMTTNGFKLRVDGLAGQGPLIVYVSTNLQDWKPILTNPPAVGSFDAIDAAATNQPFLFYRAVEDF